jgi:hypothetical protein
MVSYNERQSQLKALCVLLTCQLHPFSKFTQNTADKSDLLFVGKKRNFSLSDTPEKAYICNKLNDKDL